MTLAFAFIQKGYSQLKDYVDIHQLIIYELSEVS